MKKYTWQEENHVINQSCAIPSQVSSFSLIHSNLRYKYFFGSLIVMQAMLIFQSQYFSLAAFRIVQDFSM